MKNDYCSMKAVFSQTGHCSFFTNHFSFCLVILAAALLGRGEAAFSAPAPPPEPVRIIFDTDMGNDVDDAMALALLHALQSRGECRLLAVTLTKNDPLAGPFVDAINTFYGRGDIPVGVRREGGKKNGSRYLKLVEARDGDQLRYPHNLNHDTAPEAKDLIRKILAAQPDGSVTLVQVGFFSNFAGLLDAPEERELLRRKVRLLCIMGGAFQKIENHPHFLEYNVMTEISPAQKLAQDWPTPIVWSGFEIGIALPYPAVSIERDFNWTPHHIVAEAYRLYQPPPHERPTWDLTAALYAVRPDRGYFDLSPPGHVTVAADGFTRFEPAPAGGARDRFLILRADQAGRTREALVELVTQPPLEIGGDPR
jgi:inosine-uridine nucleoside N-ribohydrolase